MDRLLNLTTAMSIVLLIVVLVRAPRPHSRGILGQLAARCRRHSGAVPGAPQLDLFRRMAGLPDTPLTLFLLGAGVLLVMFFRFSVIISHLRDDNIALAQRVAILEYHLHHLREHEG